MSAGESRVEETDFDDDDTGPIEPEEIFLSQGYQTNLHLYDDPACRVPLMQRFDTHVDRRKAFVTYEHLGECWPWQGPYTDFGHGVFRDGDMWFLAHRVSFQLEYGSLEKLPDAVVRHRCDVPHCVRPKHLLVGTQDQNMYDMFERGRSQVSIRQIVGIRKNTGSTRIVAGVHKVSPSTVAKIRKRGAYAFIGKDGEFAGERLDPKLVAELHAPVPKYEFAVREGIVGRRR